MKKDTIIMLTLLFSTFSAVNSQQGSGPLPTLGRDPVNRVVAAMTPEEKAAFVVGTGIRIPGMTQQQNSNAAPERVPGAAGATLAIPRLGIPSMIIADGPAGLRINPTRNNDQAKYYCTAFPIATLLASGWDTENVKKVGEAMGNEVLEYGVDIILGPGMNIHRNPLNGRNFEYYSEDPLLSGKMAAAMVTGIQSQGVGTSVKHFAANNAETNRNALNTIVSERALREMYLKGFGIAVRESNPWTVMSSYNLINDTYAAENTDLLTNVLRNDWGFRGLVMTDWFGGKDPAAMMKAGNDLLMPGLPNQSEAILKALNSGTLSMDVLDRNVTRILNIILQSPSFRKYKYSNKPDLEAHASVARSAATDGLILLKNSDNALPLPENIRMIALFGNSSYHLISGGTGSGDVNEAYTVSLAEGMRKAGYSLSEGLEKLYSSYMEMSRVGRPARTGIMAFMGEEPIEELVISKDIIKGAAATTEAAIITIGRNAGEGRDRENKKGDFLLTDSEFQMIRDVSEIYRAKGKKVIVVLNVGGVVETASWKEFPDAILLPWQGGQEAGNAIADVISGKISPSGKLPMTFPVRYEDVPSAKTFPGSVLTESKPPQDSPLDAFMRVKPSIVYYEDGIYVGYRYYETFNVQPSYEFGYGLSYTSFEYSNIKVSPAAFSRSVTVTVDISNSGKDDGREVVQLYLAAPQKKLDKPSMELKGFAKTRLLQPGEQQTIIFTIDRMAISSFDPESSSWVADAGTYEVRIGASSKDIRQKASFTLARDISAGSVSRSLVPKDKIDELKPANR